jgi:hypothetical protein
MIVGGGSFACWPGWWSWFCDPGFYVGNAWRVGGDLPTTRPFALRHKRYVREAIQEKSGEYLETKRSYRRVVRPSGRPVTYEPEKGFLGLALLRRLSGSSVWRWLTWLGSLPKTATGACELIYQREPGMGLHREPCLVSPAKCRSDPRRQRLGEALRLLRIGRTFVGLFGREIFPGMATVHGWS